MRAGVGRRLIGLVGCLGLCGGLAGQVSSKPVLVKPAPGRSLSGGVGSALVPQSAAGVITAAAARAGVIFAGRVLTIDREDAAGFVDVRFHVDQAVRGCGTGDTYVLREWSGLWSGQQPRYREGERLLMMLAPRGRSGMSAPVDGLAGAIPLVSRGQPPLMDAKGHVPADSAAAGSQGVDLRWVETLAARTAVLPAAAGSGSSNSRGEWRGVVARLASAGKVAGPGVVMGASGQADIPSLASVLALLGPNRSIPTPVDRP